jgi:hypothetical protein
MRRREVGERKTKRREEKGKQTDKMRRVSLYYAELRLRRRRKWWCSESTPPE